MKRFEDRLLKHLLKHAYPARSARRRWLRRRVVLIAVPVVLLGGVALARTVVIPTAPGVLEPRSPAAAKHLALQQQAAGLINEALLHVNGTKRECRPPYRRGRARPVHGPPSQAFLDVLAPLRRPAKARDRQQTGNRGMGHGTYLDYVRQVTAANGAHLTIIIGRDLREVKPPPKHCLDAERARLLTLLEGRPAELRSFTLTEFDTLRREREKVPPNRATPVDRIYVYESRGGSGGIDVDAFRRHGLFGSSGSSGDPSRPDASRPVSTLAGLVPDGVATVTVHYPKVVSHGPLFKPTAYPAAVTRTVRVRENAVSIRKIPRSAGGAVEGATMTWRDAAGAVIRSFRLDRP